MKRLLSGLLFAPLLLIVYVLLLLPVVVVVLTSLTVEPSPTLPWSGVTLEWYGELLANERYMNAIVTSVFAACATAIVAGTVGTIAAFGFVRGGFRGKDTAATFMLLPLMISPVITGLAFLRFAGQLSIPRGYPRIVIAHSVIALPFVFLIVRSRLATFDERLEDASMLMGANRLETTFNVTLPVMAPAMIAGMLIAFVISFGEFAATQFLVTAQITTVPIVIYTRIGTGLSPEISALATLLVVGMIVVSAASERLG